MRVVTCCSCGSSCLANIGCFDASDNLAADVVDVFLVVGFGLFVDFDGFDFLVDARASLVTGGQRSIEVSGTSSSFELLVKHALRDCFFLSPFRGVPLVLAVPERGFLRVTMVDVL